LATQPKLKLDELLTRRYSFSRIDEIYEAVGDGKGIRSVVTF
jgi:Zn-dependent alcohol dehydrogenase